MRALARSLTKTTLHILEDDDERRAELGEPLVTDVAQKNGDNNTQKIGGDEESDGEHNDGDGREKKEEKDQKEHEDEDEDEDEEADEEGWSESDDEEADSVNESFHSALQRLKEEAGQNCSPGSRKQSKNNFKRLLRSNSKYVGKINRKLRQSIARREKAVRKHRRDHAKLMREQSSVGDGTLPVLVQLTAAQANTLLLSAREMNGASTPRSAIFVRPTPPAEGKSSAARARRHVSSARPHRSTKWDCARSAHQRTLSGRRVHSAGDAGASTAECIVAPPITRRRKATPPPSAAEVEELLGGAARRRSQASARPVIIFAVEGTLAEGCRCLPNCDTLAVATEPGGQKGVECTYPHCTAWFVWVCHVYATASRATSRQSGTNASTRTYMYGQGSPRD
eukprot:SAG11_NODE_539_length_8658_cov_8.164973_1_plen_396_part_00